MADPLHQERINFKSNRDHVKATLGAVMDYYIASHKVTLPTPEKFEDNRVELSKDPGRHMHQ